VRTTLDIDPDVLQAAKELAERQGRTAGQVVSELARRGLLAPSGPSRVGDAALRGGVPVLPPRGEIVTIAHVQRLLDEDAG
jgi:hypothetical protein